MALKIAIVAESVSLERGGAETSMAQYIQELLRQGLEVDLYTTSPVEPQAGLNARHIEVSDTPRALRTRSFARRVDQLLALRDYDVVHATTPCARADIYQPRGGAAPESLARNLALRPNGAARTLKRLANRLNVKQQALLIMERALVRRRPQPVIAAISDYVRKQFARHYDLDPRRIRLIYNAVAYQPRDPQEVQRDRADIRGQHHIRPDEPVALIVAHNFKLKGIAEWMRAASLLRRSGSTPFKSLIVGRGDPGPYLRMAEALGIRELMTFAGPTSRIETYFAAADVLVHPTYYDPCSRVVLEALLHGLPCVTTRYNGAAEVVEDHVTGRVLDEPGDIGELAAAACQAASPQFRIALQSRHSGLLERLSMTRHAREMIDLYESVKQRVVHR